MSGQRLKPNVVTFNTVLSACEKGRRWEQALRWLDQLREEILTPNVVTSSAAISACETRLQWVRAVTLLDDLLQKGLEPGVITCSALVSACGKGEAWELRFLAQRGTLLPGMTQSRIAA